MIVITFIIIGALVGALTARKRKGSKADMLQYGTVYAIAFGLGGLILTILIEKLVF
jgi:hypothetical protein